MFDSLVEGKLERGDQRATRQSSLLAVGTRAL